jgi:hypothetical protein
MSAPVNLLDAQTGAATKVTAAQRALTQSSMVDRIAQVSLDKADAYFSF